MNGRDKHSSLICHIVSDEENKKGFVTMTPALRHLLPQDAHHCAAEQTQEGGPPEVPLRFHRLHRVLRLRPGDRVINHFFSPLTFR